MKKLITLTLSLLIAFSLCLTVSADAAVAKDSNGGKYNSLSDAFSNASDGSTITLESDCTLSSSIYVNKSFTLDLNGKTLTIDGGCLAFDKNITIKDSSTDSAGKILVTGHSNMANAGIIVRKSAEFILKSGTIKNTCNESQSTIAVNGKLNSSDASKVTINGGKIESVNEPCILASYDGPIVEINGGTLLTDNYVDVIKTGSNPSNVSITVKGGTFSSDVSEYLDSTSKIIKGGDNKYKVYGENDKVTVDEDTKVLAALSGSARNTINNASSVKVHKVQEEFAVEYFTGSSFTKFDLSSNFIEISSEDEKKLKV